MVPPEDPVRILLVEDSRSDIYLFREALRTEFQNLDLHVLENGDQASAWIASAETGGALLPDILLLDLNLPKCDSLEMLRRVKGVPGGGGLPVIVVSSSESPRDLEDSRRLGAASFFQKPSTLTEFMRIGPLVSGLLRPPL